MAKSVTTFDKKYINKISVIKNNQTVNGAGYFALTAYGSRIFPSPTGSPKENKRYATAINIVQNPKGNLWV